MKYIFSIKNVVIFIFPLVLLAQNNQKDLAKLSYNELWVLFYKDFDKKNNQIKYAKHYLKKAEGEENQVHKGRGYYLLALSIYEDDENQCLSFLKKALYYSKMTGDRYMMATEYFDIAGILERRLKFKEAVNNYILAEKSNDDEDFSYVLKLNIAVIKSEYLGEVEEAIVLYKQCFNFYKKKGVRDPKYNSFYQEILFDLADAYKAKKMVDSATYYNKLGFNEAKFSNDEHMLSLFVLNEGANQVVNNNFTIALDSIKKALPIMLKYENKGNTLAAYYYFGKAYQGLGNEKLAVKNFQLVDSIGLKNKKITPEFVSGYNYLISYYKKNGDNENQLKYLTRLMSIDSVFQKNYKEVYKTIQKEYVIPNLLKDKEILISSLRKDKTNTYWGIGFSFILIIGVSIFGINQYKQKRLYRKRFEKIISDSNLIEKEGKNLNISEVERNDDIGIASEVVSQILEKLHDFELEKKFLQNSITLQSLSDEFNTNNKYLSKVVKKYKRKTFIQYINDLRIVYAINQLQKDKKLRNYTIIALTKEFGFNNTESFTSAFVKKTGIRPTYFIKELEELN